jgi:predicted kinase
MRKLIFVSGSINSGKTTVSRLLVRSVPNSAHVHGDSLRHFVTWMPLKDAVPLTIVNIIAVSTNLLKAGLSVVVDYPLAKPEYERIVGALERHATSVHAFTLSPRLEVAQSVRGDRTLTEWEVSRIEQHFAMGLNNPGCGVVIDNSDQTPEETVDYILGQLGSSQPAK